MIRRGADPSKKSPATLRDVAKLAGVSTSTVSRTLERPEAVAGETQLRVMEAVAACGYTPNISARNLRKMETRLITVVLPDVTNPFFNEIVRGVEQVAREHGYSVLLADTENLPGQETAYGNLLAARQTDGLILLNGRIPNGLLPSEGSSGKMPPIVVACEYVANLDLPTVQIDNIKAAREATEHLLGLGHKRIGFITGPLWSVLSRDRLHGYRDAILDAGLEYDEGLVVAGNFSIISGLSAARQLLSVPRPPTAIFASNDEMAIGTIRAARDQGLRVPDDLSVMGFDDIRFAAFMDPPLTTVSQPGGDIGRNAMQLLLKIMQSSPIERRRILLPTHLELRSSTARLKPAD